MAENQESKAGVLIIDDDTHLRLSLRDFLSMRGYDVEVAASAEEGIRLLKRHQPGLVILDIAMPGIGGTGFLKRMAEGALPAVPVIVLSARADAASFFESLDIEAFLPKPCEGQVLLEHINEVLHKSSQPNRPAQARNELILIAENDAIVSSMVKTALENDVFRTRLVRTGPEVLESAPKLKPDVIVLREYLPGMNGSVLASLLSAMSTTRTIPVVLYDDSGWIEKKLDQGEELKGVSEYVPSTNARRLLAAVKGIVDKKI